MEFYKNIFGGELQLTTYAEGPPEAHADPKANSEEMKSKIMFAKLDGDITIMASDNPHNTNAQNTGQFSLSIEGTDEELLTGYFNKLSENGQVMSPLQEQFWGVTFGMLTDRFGIDWMINIQPNIEFLKLHRQNQDNLFSQNQFWLTKELSHKTANTESVELGFIHRGTL